MGLSQREKYLLILGLILFVPLLLFRFVFVPFNNSQKSLEEKTADLKEKTRKISMLGQEYNSLKRETRISSVSLTKRIDSILRQYRLKARSQIALEEHPKGGQKLKLTVDEIYLTELAKFIYRIENNKPVIMIDTIDIIPSYKNKKLFKVTLGLISN